MNTQPNNGTRDTRRRRRTAPLRVLLAVPLLSAGALGLAALPAAAVPVSNEGELRAAFLDANETEITLDADVTLGNCALGSLKRNSATDIVINGNGHIIDQTCAGARVVNSSGSGALTLVDVTITGGNVASWGGGLVAHGNVTLDAATFVDNNSTNATAGALLTYESIEITDSTFTNNSAPFGIGAVGVNGTATISGSTFDGNTAAAGVGGAVAAEEAVTVSNSEFVNNTADIAGAIITDGAIGLTDSTFTGNTAANGMGGAIRGGAGAITVSGGEFSDNSAASDGGAIAADSDIEVSGAMFTDNNAAVAGGALYSEGEALVSDSELSGNVGQAAAGAIYAVGDVTVEGSTLTGNIVDASGGGAIQSGSASVFLRDSMLTDNVAGVGGAVWAPVGEVSAVRSTLAGNYAFAGSGGAISAGDAVSVEASTLSGNEAFTNGGAIRAGAGIVTLTNATVSGNKAEKDGGGLWVDGSVDLRHVTLADNVAGAGGNLYIDNGAATLTSFGSVLGRSNTDNCVVAAGGTSSAGFNVADDASCGLSDTSDEQAAGDLQLATLADNGGSTMTHLPAATSPLVDVIASGDCDGAVDTDQRGTDRPQGDGCDVGAVELVPEPEGEPGGGSGSGSGSGSGGGAGSGGGPGSGGGTNSGGGSSSGAGPHGGASGSDGSGAAGGGESADDETGATEDDREAGDGVPVSDESSPSTGTSVSPFLIAVALLFAAGLIILFADRKRQKRGRKPARVQEPPTAEASSIGW